MTVDELEKYDHSVALMPLNNHIWGGVMQKARICSPNLESVLEAGGLSQDSVRSARDFSRTGVRIHKYAMAVVSNLLSDHT